MKALSVKQRILRLIFSFVCGGLGVLLEYLEIIPLATAFLAVVFIWWGLWYFGVAAIVMLALNSCLFGLSGLAHSVVIAILAAVVTVALLKRKPYRSILAGLAGALTLFVFISGVAPALIAGESAFSLIRQNMEDITIATGGVPSQTPSAELFVAIAILLGMIYAGVSVLLIYNFSKRVTARVKDADTSLKPMAPFYSWTLSKNFNVGLGVWAAALIVILATDPPNSGPVLMAMLVVMGLPLCVQGASLLWFMGKAGCAMFYSKWTFIIVLLLLYPSSVFMLAIAGLLEQFMHMRKRVSQLPKR